MQQTQINLPFITATADGPLHLDESLTRSKFQEMTADLIERCRIPFEQALKDASVTKGDLHHVILVGGATRMPAVQDLVNALTGKEPNKSVNPDEVVAVGAAIQAGVLRGDVKDVLLLDVTPLSLGIETKGGVMTKLIERNTTIPTRRTEVFTTAEDMQPSVEIHVLQGEREMATYNKTLGKFQLVDLPPAPRGVPQIEVTFDIDANGIVHVSAKDRATNKEQSMTISGQSTLPKDDIDRMVKDAEAHAEEDRKRREEAEVRNNADTLVYQTEKVLREQGESVSSEEREAVEQPLADLKKALEGDDMAAIKSASETLMSASQAFSQKLYEAAARDANAAGTSASGQTGSAGAGSVSDDEIVDAEVVDDDSDTRRPGMSEQPDDLERLDGIEGELGAGPDIVEEFWEGDDTADVIEADDDELLADTIDTEIHELSNERDQFKDIAQRLQADFDNYRKRTTTHLAAEIDRATGRLAEALLPVLDATEAAYLQHPDEVGPLFNLMLAELRKHGLEPIDLLGKPFDPNLADAVAHEPGDGGEPVVAEVLRSGYLWNGRTLRPAMVRTRD